MLRNFLGLVLLLTLMLGAAPASASPTTSVPAARHAEAVSRPVAVPFRDGRGLEVLAADNIGARQWRLTVRTDELAKPVRVTVLLPRGYKNSTRRYPVLHLLHGTSGGATDWLENGDVIRSTRDLRLVVVMPDGGYEGNGGSWWTNWVDQTTPLGKANWENFHIEQLVPWIDDNLRTIPGRHGRAIAGLSQGGFGAFSYAARHPDLFVSAASFSGAPDIARNPLAATAGSAVVGAIMTGLNGVQPFAAFGDPVLDSIIWKGHNPADLVTNLSATDLHLWTARGTPGELEEEPLPNPGSVAIETITHLSTRFFADAADAAKVPYQLTDYGNGTHTWPYWSQHLREYLPSLMAVFAERRAVPKKARYRSIDKVWTQWGWRVNNKRSTQHAWSALRGAHKGGFTLVAGNDAVVRTPKWFRPGQKFTVRYDGGTGPAKVTARKSGRVKVRVTPQTRPLQPNTPVRVVLTRR